MNLLVSNFWGYLKLYQVKISQIILLGLFIELFFIILKKKGVITYKDSTNWTRICGLFLSCAISWVITMTLLGRSVGEEFEVHLIPFGSYIHVFQVGDVEILLQIIMNVVMFMPIGLLLPRCFQKFEKNQRLFLTALLSSCGIELLQGILKIGIFEVDDVLGNVLGAEIGFLIWWVSRLWKTGGML